MKLYHHLLTLLIAFSTMAVALPACNQEPERDPNKHYADITTDAITCIKAEQAITVNFVQTEGVPHVTVCTKKKLAALPDVHMEGTILVAALKSGANIPESGIEVTVKAPSVNEIIANNAACVNLGDELTLTGELRVTCDNAASVKCKKVACSNMILQADNASLIQLSGIKATNVSAHAVNAASILLDGKTESSHYEMQNERQIHASKLATNNGSKTILPHPEYTANNMPPVPLISSKPKTEPEKTAAEKPAADKNAAGKTDAVKAAPEKPAATQKAADKPEAAKTAEPQPTTPR